MSQYNELASLCRSMRVKRPAQADVTQNSKRGDPQRITVDMIRNAVTSARKDNRVAR